MKMVDQRLDKMIDIAESQGETLDAVVRSIGRIDQRSFDAVSDKPSRLPLYMKSSVKP